MPVTVCPKTPRDLPEIRAELHTHWHDTRIWSLGRCHQADALHKGIVDRVRTLVPDLPLLGHDGIQTRDEIEFERWFVDEAIS